MIEVAAHARKAGIRVRVITSSWGMEPYDPYMGYQLKECYDAMVVSSEVRLRKPDRAIYRLAADKLGMATIHHVDSSRTIAELQRLLGLVKSPGHVWSTWPRPADPILDRGSRDVGCRPIGTVFWE